MNTDELADLMRKRLSARDQNAAELAELLARLVSHQTVYNALAGKPVRSDTLLALLDELDLEIRPKKGAK